jgi:hypothetical protein
MCFLTQIYSFITNDKWWPFVCQLGASKRKTVVGIAATALLWIEDMKYDPNTPVLPFYILLVTINVLFHTFSFFCTTKDKWWCQCEPGASKRKRMVDIVATTFLLIEDMEYDQNRPVLPIWHAAGNPTCASSHFVILYVTKDKWWPMCQLGASSRKTVMGIAATSFLWIEDMEYDQYRPILPF